MNHMGSFSGLSFKWRLEQIIRRKRLRMDTKYRKCLEEVETAITLYPDSCTYPEVWLLAGDFAKPAGNQNDPSRPQGAYEAALAQLVDGAPGLATVWHPDSPQFWLLRAVILYRLKRLAEIEDAYESLRGLINVRAQADGWGVDAVLPRVGVLAALAAWSITGPGKAAAEDLVSRISPYPLYYLYLTRHFSQISAEIPIFGTPLDDWFGVDQDLNEQMFGAWKIGALDVQQYTRSQFDALDDSMVRRADSNFKDLSVTLHNLALATWFKGSKD